MWAYALRRILGAVPTIIGILTIVFLLVRLVPGDPARAILGQYATPGNVEAMNEALGLDKPLLDQYLSFMKGAVLLDFGRSFKTKQEVSERILDALPYTLQLAAAALVVAILIGIPVGVLAAVKRNTPLDYGATFVALLGISMPNFWLGMLLLLTFSVSLGWLPITGAGNAENPLTILRYLLLPAITLGTSEAGTLMRMTRSSMLETMGLDFVRTATAKGLPPTNVVMQHVLRNSLIPVVTIVALNVGRLVGGTVIVESLFVRPGIGRVMIDAMVARDYPQIQGTVAFFAIVIILVNLVVDLAYGFLDPRIKYG